jgi:hypothetical protein
LYILTFTFLDSRRDDKNSEPNGGKHSLNLKLRTQLMNKQFLCKKTR